MEFIIDNWVVIIIALALIASVVLAMIKFVKKPSSEQLEKVKAWLLWAVTQAERDLGAGTGKLKLSMVYGVFVEKFSWIAKMLPFITFTSLVDSALDVMKEMLKDNKAVVAVVSGSSDNAES